ncbi:hypothetical protein ACX80U_12205 [Arthrobacter sp. TmT3-37]
MTALAFAAGAIAGGIIWSLISYYLIHSLLDIQDQDHESEGCRGRQGT